MRVKAYYLPTILHFGIHQGRTIEAVLGANPDYLSWCIRNLNHFCVSTDIMSSLKEKITNFAEVEIANQGKLKRRKNESSMDSTNRPSFGKYQGTYAQDVEGLSDDFIDDVLDGFPDAYWNID